MTNIYGAWVRYHSLHFIHPEYGTIVRNQHSEWEQNHVENGLRILKSELLKDAFLEAEKPYKKPKSKVKPVKRMRTRKPKVLEEVKSEKPKVKKTVKKKRKKKS